MFAQIKDYQYFCGELEIDYYGRVCVSAQGIPKDAAMEARIARRNGTFD
jgi:hypothetical protein